MTSENRDGKWPTKRRRRRNPAPGLLFDDNHSRGNTTGPPTRIYRGLMPTHGGEDDVDGCVRQIAMGLHPRVAEMTADIQRRLDDELPELGLATRTADMLEAGIGGNLDALLHALRYGIDIARVQAPTAAMEHARRLAQQGVPVHALVRAYRIGQRRMNELVFGEVNATDMSPMLRIRVLERISTTLFDYIDWISQQVVETYEVERERWLENQNSLRALRVRELLTGRVSVDVDAATSAIRYPLGWHHLALVLWRPWDNADDNALLGLQRFLREAADLTEASASALFVAADRATGWGWLPFHSAAPEAVEQVRRLATKCSDPLGVAIGTLTPGVNGFRTSHWLANAAYSVAVARDPRQPCVIAAGDPGVAAAALLGGELTQARLWVAEILGDLAADTDNDALLRETLYVFLSAGGSRKAAGEKMTLHPNTVKYRIDRAIARRGRNIGVDRLDVELALLLCHWYGDAVLKQDD